MEEWNGKEKNNKISGTGSIISGIGSIFTNAKTLNNARTTIIVFIVALAPLFYFAYSDSISLEKLLTFQFGGLSAVVGLSAYITNKETKKRAFENAYDLDTELEKFEKSYQANGDKIQAKDKTMILSTQFIAEYNRNQQKALNKILTEDKIAKLEPIAIKHRINGKEKKANKIEKKIAKLHESFLFDKKFVPYNPQLIINANTNKQWNKHKKKGNAEINNDPTKVNPAFQLSSTVARGLTGGLAGTLLITFTDPFSTIFWFYITYFAIMALTVITGYALTVFKTLGSYKNGLRKKITIQQLLLDHIEKESLNTAKMGDNTAPPIISNKKEG